MFLSTIALTVALTAPIAPTNCTGDELCNAPAASVAAWDLFEDKGYHLDVAPGVGYEFLGYYDGSANLSETEFALSDDSGREYIFEVSMNPLFIPVTA